MLSEGIQLAPLSVSTAEAISLLACQFLAVFILKSPLPNSIFFLPFKSQLMLASRQISLVCEPFCLKLSANLLIFRFFLDRSDLKFAPSQQFKFLGSLPTLRELESLPLFGLQQRLAFLVGSHLFATLPKADECC